MSVPKEAPEVENLNSYYLNISKLIEHYQGEFGAGCVHFKSTDSEGTIFFDQDEIISGIINQNGVPSIDYLIQAVADHNYAVDVYRINPDVIYFWVGAAKAERIYENLSTEFTNLDALIKKMNSEKLTGYIDVTIGKGEKSGIIFLHNGTIVGGSYSWTLGKNHKENIKRLIRETMESGGVFHVGRILPVETEKPKTAEITPAETDMEVLQIIEGFLNIAEKVVTGNKKIKVAFSTLLKKKFIQKADQFTFLDPFAAEFKYADGTVTFVGNAGEGELLRGVIDSVRELSEETGLFSRLAESLKPWSIKYAKALERLGIHF